MSLAAAANWEQANQAYLTEALANLRAKLERFIASAGRSPAHDDLPAWPDLPAQPAIETIASTFGLTDFERALLLMCAATELDMRFRSIFATASEERRHSLPTFGLALAAFEDAHWSALSPGRPLRYWRLIEVGAGDTLTSSPLHIDERILHYLTGFSSIDERLRGLTDPVPAPGTLVDSHRTIAKAAAAAWSRTDINVAWPLIQLSGCEIGSKRAIAAAACQTLGLSLRRMTVASLPRTPAELDLLLRLWDRETALERFCLLLECDELDRSDAVSEAAVRRLTETLRSPFFLSVRERLSSMDRPHIGLEVPRLAAGEQIEIWRTALCAAGADLNGSVERLASQFTLNRVDIQMAAAQALKGGQGDLTSILWDTCKAYTRPRMDALAQRIEAAASWDDLVLPDEQKEILRRIVSHVRQRVKVYQRWGFASKGARGLGIGALFAGPSGTGKTMAGEVLAAELNLDLHRIDLSEVVSKYIGETEKNLRRVFDAAEEGASILMFDEADALFGKRSEVKDSHDRYANIEVSYLLQRMEAYRGLAILTTNRREAIDPAFLRRIRFVVMFPFPDAVQRAEIWRRVFPQQTPTADLRIDRLARLNAAGGHIRNIALSAAFLAAEAGEPVRMAHLLSAARTEFAKLERPLTDAETAGWA